MLLQYNIEDVAHCHCGLGMTSTIVTKTIHRPSHFFSILTELLTAKTRKNVRTIRASFIPVKNAICSYKAK